MINLILPIAGALIYRFRGSDQKILPRPLPQMLFAAPYAWLVFAHYSHVQTAAILATISLALTVWALVKGHGRAFRLNEPMKPGAKPEDIEWPILWLEGKIPLYWYKVTIHLLSGLSYTLTAGLLTLNPFLALSGVLKAPAYMISEKMGYGTEGGEYLTGAFLWGVVAWVIM